MITEETFQSDLDTNPANHGLRLVFADWLEEQGDPRAEFYRWLGRNQVAPVNAVFFNTSDSWEWFWAWNQECTEDIQTSCLPISMNHATAYGINDSFATRRDAEEALAKVFAAHPKLFPDRGRRRRRASTIKG